MRSLIFNCKKTAVSRVATARAWDGQRQDSEYEQAQHNGVP